MSVVTVAELDTYITGQGIYAGTANYPATWTGAFRQSRIDAAESWIARYTGRVLVAAAAQRRFDGKGTNHLFIDDAVTITEVKVGSDGDALTSGTDYYQYPANSTPKTRLDKLETSPTDPLIDQNIYSGRWSRGQQNIYVTATWGYFASGSAPDDLKEAILMLASLFLVSGKGIPPVSAMAIRSYSAGSVKVQYADGSRQPIPDLTGWGDYVKAILDGHKRIDRWQT